MMENEDIIKSNPMWSPKRAATTTLQDFWNKNHYIRIKSVEK